MKRLALAAIVKDEQPHIREWLAYYRLRGVAHVYLAVNDDDPAPLCADLAPLVAFGWITVRHWPGHAQQLAAYNWAVAEALKDGYPWLAALDADEFLATSAHDLPSALDGLTAGAVAVNWRTFGHHGLGAAPASVLDSNVWRLPLAHRWNQHVKVIVQPKAVKGFILPHAVWLKRGYQTRTPGGVVVDGPFAPVTSQTGSVLMLAHYCLRSRADWIRKMQRGRADLPPSGVPHWDWTFHDQIEAAAIEQDDTMRRYVPDVQAMQRAIWGLERPQGDAPQRQDEERQERQDQSRGNRGQRPLEHEADHADKRHVDVGHDDTDNRGKRDRRGIGHAAEDTTQPCRLPSSFS